MSDNGSGSPEVTFGYMLHSIPSGFPEAIMSDSTQATLALMEAIERGIEMARPHFDTIWIEDHLQWEERPLLEAITALSYLIGRHTGLRFGHLVLCQSFRNPALTAKVAAVLQVMSGGRYILGIGAGWKDDEYIAYGYPYPSDGVRIEQLAEAIQVIRALWTTSPANFKGQYYSVTNAQCHPQPQPMIPILVGGGGEKRTLRVAAEHADWWTAPVQSIEEYARKQRVLADHCRAVGRDPGSILHTFCARVSLALDPDKVVRRPGRYIIGGTPTMVTRELESLVALGVRHFQLSFLDFPHLDSLQLFIERVIPRIVG